MEPISSSPDGSPRVLTRRGALATLTALAAGSLAGCGLLGGQKVGPERPHPLTEHLLKARELAQAYDAALAVDPALAGTYGTLRDNHWAHAAALAKETREVTPSDTSASTASSTAPTKAMLLAAEQEAHRMAYEAALTLPGVYTPLLGSIVACRATHVEVLG